MGKKIKIFALSGLAALTAGAAISATLAWFASRVQLPDVTITGSSGGAYFESGTGESGNPFIISRPRHLYNLAWLQDMGAFNQYQTDADGNVIYQDDKPVIKQVYFRIKPTLKDVGLNMNGMYIPPIGTSQYPFLGNFDGSDVIISNFVVTNNFSEYGNNHPRNISAFVDEGETGIEQPKIVGFFGVVGELDTGLYTYTSSVNALYNFGLENCEVKTTTDESLIGIAVGYLNAVTSNVAVEQGKLTVEEENVASLDDITTDLSDYTVVGYSKRSTKLNKATNTIHGVDASKADYVALEDGVEKGGSINMLNLYDRLTKIKGQSSTYPNTAHTNGTTYTNGNYRFYYKWTKTYNADWTTVTSEEHTTNDYLTTSMHYYHSDPQMGNYEIFEGNSANYVYTGGGHYETSSFYDYFYRINDGNGNFLHFDGTNISNVNTGEDDANAWAVPPDDTGKIYTIINGTNYYLRVNGNNLTTTTNADNATVWTKEEKTVNTTTYTRYSYDGKALYFNGTNWVLQAFSNPIKPDDPEYYHPTEDRVSNPGSAPSEPVEPQPNTAFQLYMGGYYLKPNSSGNGFAASTSVYNPGWTYSNNRLSTAVPNVGTRYLRINNDTVSLENSTNNASTFQHSTSGNYVYYSVTSGGGCGSSSTTYYLILNSSGTPTTTTNSSSVQLEQRETTTYKGVFGLYSDLHSQWGTDYTNWEGEKEEWQRQKDIYDAWQEYDSLVSSYETDLADYESALSVYNSTFCIKLNQVSVDHPWSGGQTYITDDKGGDGMAYTPDDTTYFPLNVDTDGSAATSLTQYRPKNSNTGYMVTGADYSSASNSNPDTIHGTSNLRVSKYNIDNISASYSNKTLGNVYTMVTNDSGGLDFALASDVYSGDEWNYTKSASGLSPFLQKGGSYVYGLHFTRNVISKKQTVKLKYAKLNTIDEPGKEYSNYELPVNSICFKLIDKGYINFFAGMYFSGNDSFFSLYQMERGDDVRELKDIKRIVEVYSDGIDNHSYIYKYEDGRYSKPYQNTPTGSKVDFDYQEYDPSKPSMNEFQIPTEYKDGGGVSHFCTYRKVFDSVQIENHRNGSTDRVNSSLTNGGSFTNKYGSTVQVNKSIFYFEIPMNEGDFCLGSVDGGTGGYLFYLDIGAGARKIDRTSFLTHYKYLMETEEYPLDVAFKDMTVGSNIVVESGEGAFFTVKESYQDTLEITTVGNKIYASDGYDATYIKALFKNNEVTLYNGPPPSTTEIEVAPRQSITEVWTLELFDFNAANMSYTRSVIIDTYIDGEAQDRIAKQYQNGSATPTFDTTDPNKSNPDLAVFYELVDGEPVEKTYAQMTVPTTGTDVLIPIVEFYYSDNNLVIGDIIIDLTSVKAGDNNYFIANGFTVQVIVDSGSITITTLKKDGLPASYSSITITPASGNPFTISGMNVTP